MGYNATTEIVEKLFEVGMEEEALTNSPPVADTRIVQAGLPASVV
jgi:hypothetical protein